jgi:hypothetical protein
MVPNTSGGSAAPWAGATAQPAAPRRRRIMILSIVIAACVAVALTHWLKRPPAASAGAVKVSRFVASAQIEKIPDAEKRSYLDAVREDKKDIYQAYAKQQITPREYENALLSAWISRTLKHVDDFSKLEPGPKRTMFLDRIVNKGEKKRRTTTRPSTSTIYDRDPYDLPEVQRVVATLAPDERVHWNEFRDALRKYRLSKRVQPSSGIWY